MWQECHVSSIRGMDMKNPQKLRTPHVYSGFRPEMLRAPVGTKAAAI
jgi:hypothetical protein